MKTGEDRKTGEDMKTTSARVGLAPALALALAFALALPACGFVEAAGEITMGKGQVPRVTYDLAFPKVDDLLGPAIKGLGSSAIPGLPTSFEAGTLAHMQGLMTIDGECRRQLTEKEVKAAAGSLRNLSVEVINCGDPNRCVDYCKGFRGVKLEARVQFELLDAATSKKVVELLADTSPDAIVQIRAQFSKLAFYQKDAAGKKTETNQLFSGYELGVSSPGGGDDTVIVEHRFLSSITPTDPQRFELDRFAPFTSTIKANVLKGQGQWLEVFQRLAVPQGNLYSVRLGNAGIDLDFQPEIVISAIEVAKGQL